LSGEAERPPQLVAVHDPAADAVGPAEQRARLRELAPRQRLAHRRARDSRPVERDARHRLDFEAVLAPCPLDHCRVSGALRTEPEIVAHQQPAHPQRLDEHPAHEVLGRQPRESTRESLHVHVVHAVRAEQLELLAQAGETGRRRRRREELAWMRLEREHARQETTPARGLRQAREQRLVAFVNAVEIADREGDRSVDARRKSMGDEHEPNPKLPEKL